MPQIPVFFFIFSFFKPTKLVLAPACQSLPPRSCGGEAFPNSLGFGELLWGDVSRTPA